MEVMTLVRDLVSGTHKRSCGVSIHLRHKVDKHRHMVLGVSCGSWDCDKCRPNLQHRWIEHLTQLFSSSPRIYVSLVSKARWATVAIRIRRAGEQFVTVEQEVGLLTVFTALPYGEAFTSGEAVLSMLEKAIHNAITSHRPIHTSRGWGFPKDIAGKVSDWERVKKLPVSIDEARDVVSSMGLTVNWFWAGCRTGFIVNLPYSWGEDELAVFNERLDELRRTTTWEDTPKPTTMPVVRTVSQVGFDLLYQTYCSTRHFDKIYDTKIIKHVAEAMFLLGWLDAKTAFYGVKTVGGIKRRLTALGKSHNKPHSDTTQGE